MEEKWVDVLGFENCYQVSNTGKVRSKTRTHMTRNHYKEFERTVVGKELKQNMNPNGYKGIELYDMDRFRKRGVHVIVFESFNKLKIQKGYVIHHKDENKINNNLDNLEMISITKHNQIHSHEPWNKGIKTSKRTQNKMILPKVKTQILKAKKYRELKEKGMSVKEIAFECGVVTRTVYQVIKNEQENILKLERIENELQ